MKNYSSYLFILVLLLSHSLAYPMLILKQEKKHSPAYLCIKQRKLDKDPLIPKDGSVDGFEHIITFGKVVIENTGTIMKVAETAATMLIVNAASKWATGKNFGDLTRNRGYDTESASRIKEQEKLEKEYHRDMRIKHGLSHNDTSFKWDEKHECFIDEYGDPHYIVNSPTIEPQTDVMYTGRSLPIVSPSKPVDEPIITTYTPEFYEDGTRIVDYENNPADKAWLEDFAKKICPDGGYVIGDIIIPADEDLPSYSGVVAMPMPVGPQPNKPKHDKDYHHTTHKIIETLVENAAHHVGEESLEHVTEEWKEHDSDHNLHHKTPHIDPTVKTVTPKTTANQKTPNYDSGKRLENWEKAQEKAAASKQEPVKVEPVNTETNSARWAKDDYFYSSNSGGYHSSGGYSSPSSSSSHSTSSSYEHKGHYDIGCTLFKNDDNYDINPDRYR